MKRRLAAGLAVASLAAGLAAGCGGGDGDTAGDGAGTVTPTPRASNRPLAKAEFTRRADEICMGTINQIRAGGAKIRTKSGELPSDEQVEKFLVEVSLPAYDDMVAELRILNPPAADKARINEFIATLAVALDTVKAAPAKYAKSRRADDPFEDANTRAKAYGMKVCGS